MNTTWETFFPPSLTCCCFERAHTFSGYVWCRQKKKREKEEGNTQQHESNKKKIFQNVWVRAQKNRLNKFFTFSFFHMINFFRRAHSSSLIISLLQSLLSPPATWANISHFTFFKQEWKEEKKVLFSSPKKLTILTDVFDKFLGARDWWGVGKFLCNEKITSCTELCKRILKIHVSFRVSDGFYVVIQISPPILTCSKLWHDCERARERQDERNGVRGWKNSTVKWHRSRRRTPKKKSYHSRTPLEPSNRHFAHSTISLSSHLLSAAITNTTGMPVATEHERREGREMITNYFDISFCSVSFSLLFYLNSILLCAVLWHFWIGFMVATAMLLISWASRMPFTFTTPPEHEITFIEFLTLRLSNRVNFTSSFTFPLAHFATLSQFTLLSSVVNWSEGKRRRCWLEFNFPPRFLSSLRKPNKNFCTFSLSLFAW